ncbi:uncharacterized protein BKA55DRAFT_598348 [Fusarium redolens]|uniref:Dienelactone hydrolase domain-containing protein n=1 Tax=Fusarium redolens TaxID=48865 RepID=A0A9P9G4V6_FUSRE|nr:uncharacterized protein BKA55DRAFT_598348 [Fusarium redolens]KAH7232401.1 hypothetical protein BKA55DRAFT_598348 [Fusarium redolens]
MSCPQCFSGHINPGTPTNPPDGKRLTAVIVIIPGAFGVDFLNNQILADHYASAANYLVYLSDFIDGNAAPVRTMINMAHLWDETGSWISRLLAPPKLDFVPFLYRNRFNAALPVVIAGFCWGGLHTVGLTHDTEETKTDIGNFTCNLSIAIGDDDGVMGMKQVRQAESILASKDVDTSVVTYPGAKHGFSIHASRAKQDSKETR